MTRWQRLGEGEVGQEYAAFIADNRARLVDGCLRYGTAPYRDCVLEAADFRTLSHCAEGRLAPSRASWSSGPPTPSACEGQADHRIALHEHFELPSVSRAVAQSRASMVETCNRHWSERYVDCLRASPSLAHVEACEVVGRFR